MQQSGLSLARTRDANPGRRFHFQETKPYNEREGKGDPESSTEKEEQEYSLLEEGPLSPPAPFPGWDEEGLRKTTAMKVAGRGRGTPAKDGM